MKKLLAIIFLSLHFITPSQADDIKDFQIDGISVGESVLDHFSKNQIKNAKNFAYYYKKSKKFYEIGFDIKSEQYDMISFSLKKNDIKYIIYGIKGSKNYDNNHQECLKQSQKIINEILSIAGDTKNKSFKRKYPNLGQSLQVGSDFTGSYGALQSYCALWDKKNKTVKSRKYYDSLNVTAFSLEYSNFLLNEAY